MVSGQKDREEEIGKGRADREKTRFRPAKRKQLRDSPPPHTHTLTTTHTDLLSRYPEPVSSDPKHQSVYLDRLIDVNEVNYM